MNDAMLRGDCSRCTGLCCLALAFDKSEMFGFGKGAGEACRYLDAACRCTIHDGRVQQGFSGCVSYDCYGAGQRVTALFAGHDWRTDKATQDAMIDAFSVVSRLHEMVFLLRAARQMRLPPTEEIRLAELAERLEVADVSSEARRHAFVRSGLLEESRAALRSLADFVSSPAAQRPRAGT